VPHSRRVLYIEQEIGEDGLGERLGSIVHNSNPDSSMFYLKTRDSTLRMDTADGRLAIENEIVACKAEVVIFDPLTKFHLLDENSAQAMSTIARVWDSWIEKYGISIIIVHHTGKQSVEFPRRGGDRLRGSSAIFGDLDTLIEVDRVSSTSNSEPVLNLRFEMRRGEPLPVMIVRRLKSGRIEYSGERRE
jgi:RecA-family ATPase